MSKKAAVPLRIAPLQHVIAVAITDATELAALKRPSVTAAGMGSA